MRAAMPALRLRARAVPHRGSCPAAASAEPARHYDSDPTVGRRLRENVKHWLKRTIARRSPGEASRIRQNCLAETMRVRRVFLLPNQRCQTILARAASSAVRNIDDRPCASGLNLHRQQGAILRQARRPTAGFLCRH